MDFLAQAIADLATLVTFQQRRPPARPAIGGDELDETACRLLSLTSHYRGNGMNEDTDLDDV